MDKFAAMQAFKLVAQERSFAGAARKLGLSRSQVNRLVLSLEDKLTVNLFNRSTRSVQLTPMGQAYFSRVDSILADLEDAERMVQDQQGSPKGQIRINAPMSFGTMYLGRALADFIKLYPKIEIQLSLSDALDDPLTQSCDITLRIAEPAENLSLIAHDIAPMPRILCAAQSYLSEHGEPKYLHELKDRRCLHYGNLPTGNHWNLLGPDGEKQITVTGAYCSNNGEVLCQAAVEGLGIALLPLFIAGPAIKQGQLVRILNDYETQPLTLQILYLPNRHLSERIRVFVEYIHTVFGNRELW